MIKRGERPKDFMGRPMPDLPAGPERDVTTWTCPMCGRLNPPMAFTCQTCGLPRMVPTQSLSANQFINELTGATIFIDAAHPANGTVDGQTIGSFPRPPAVNLVPGGPSLNGGSCLWVANESTLGAPCFRFVAAQSHVLGWLWNVNTFSFGIVGRWRTTPAGSQSGIIDVVNKMHLNTAGTGFAFLAETGAAILTDFNISTQKWFIAIGQWNGGGNGAQGGFLYVNGKRFFGTQPNNNPYGQIFLASDTASFNDVDVAAFFALGNYLMTDSEANWVGNNWGAKYGINWKTQ
jgi:hypothetical protein